MPNQELKISAFVLDRKALETSKARVTKDDMTQKEFDELAQERGFTTKVPERFSLLGYYYVNEETYDALMPCASCRKEDEIISI